MFLELKNEKSGSSEYRNVLMILFNFPPCGAVGSFRGIRFIKNLHTCKWFPYVLAPVNGYYSHYDYELQETINEYCCIHRTKWFPHFWLFKKKQTSELSRYGRMLIRIWDRILIPDGKMSWCFNSLSSALKIIKKNGIKIVYVSGGPFSAMVFGALIKKYHNVKLVLDYRDPWTLSAKTMQKQNILKNIINKGIENWVLKQADKVIMNTDQLVTRYQEIFPSIPKEKYFTITNSYDESHKALYEKIPDSNTDKDLFRIVYAGNFYGNRSPTKFFEAISLVVRNSPALKNSLRFLYVGTDKIEPYMPEINKYGLSEIINFHERVSSLEVLRYYKDADVLLLINSYGEGNDVFIPQKTFDYLMTGKPILCLTQNGALKKLLENAANVLIADPEDSSEIADAITILLKKNENIPDDSDLHIHSSKAKTVQLAHIFDSLL